VRKKRAVRVVERSFLAEAGTKEAEANRLARAWLRWRMALPAAAAGTASMAGEEAGGLEAQLAARPEVTEKSLEAVAAPLGELLPASPEN
jgi:hypothetical protein